jgi:hypothetical protein
MIAETELEATPNLLKSMPDKRILGKFSRPRRERPTRRGEPSLVTKTGIPLGNALRNVLYGEGGGDR